MKNVIFTLSMTLILYLGFAGSALAQWSISGSNVYLGSSYSRVGISTSSPTSALHVTGSSYDATPNVSGTQVASGLIELTRSSYPYVDFNEGSLGADYDSRLIYVDDSFYSDELQVRGSDFRILSNDMYVDGVVWASGFFSSSDARFKRNVAGIDNAIGLISQLSAKQYEMKAPEGSNRKFVAGTHYGFLAQDVQKVLPDLVKEDASGYLAVNYQEMIPLLVEAVKSQQQEIIALKARLEAVSLSNKAMEAELQGSFEHEAFPNPAGQLLHIRYNTGQTDGKVSVYLFDMQGRQITLKDALPTGENELSIDTNGLENGSYIYTIMVDGKVAGSSKVILEK